VIEEDVQKLSEIRQSSNKDYQLEPDIQESIGKYEMLVATATTRRESLCH